MMKAFLAFVFALGVVVPAVAADQSIVLASTTSVEASGLLANILPKITARTGITVDTARRGDADVLLDMIHRQRSSS
jgi:tungstate transport system substrate-binding protein